MKNRDLVQWESGVLGAAAAALPSAWLAEAEARKKRFRPKPTTRRERVTEWGKGKERRRRPAAAPPLTLNQNFPSYNNSSHNH
jgi:hypothetical protein